MVTKLTINIYNGIIYTMKENKFNIKAVKKIPRIFILITLLIITLLVGFNLFTRYFNFKPFCERSGGKWTEVDVTEEGSNNLYHMRECDCSYEIMERNDCEPPFDYKVTPPPSYEKKLVREAVSSCTYKPSLVYVCTTCKKDADCYFGGHEIEPIVEDYYERVTKTFCDNGICRIKRTIYALPNPPSPTGSANSGFGKF